MHIEFSDEQNMLRESVARYLVDNYDFEERRKTASEAPGFSPAHWQQFAEMGWLAMPLPEDHGGFGFGAVELMLLAGEMGRHLVLEPYLETVVVAAGLLQRGAQPEVLERCLPAIAEGTMQGALAHAEPGRHASAGNVQCRAVQAVDGGYLLSGEKAVVCNGPNADFFLVSARLADEPGLSLFFVEADMAGIERRDYATWDGRRACDLVLQEVSVPACALVGTAGGAEALIETVNDVAVVYACAESVGAMGSLLDRTRDYTAQRIQFGKSLSSFQVLRHRMADMYIEMELCRSLLQAAAQRLDQQALDARRLVSALKVRTIKAARYVSQNAIQLHGGIAMTDELPVGHYFKRLALLEHQFGSRDDHLRRFCDAA
ncbi:acyl-CoA dehydrogenase family protein [Haliea sp. E17]|uniref:acyl-CoA dehydrogenase family protein n=1 Tax=Haliea sp. E17 TaxID=3401576 RepID=UPI003AAAE5CC